MSEPPHIAPADYASIREVYSLIAAMDAKTAAAIDMLKASIMAELKAHEMLHEQHDRRQVARTRWLITTALAFGALLGGFAQTLISRIWP